MKRKTLTVLVWILTVWETLTMGLSGAAKFMGDAWQLMFATWGYPVWSSYVVGVLEIGGALLLLVPRAAPFAASGLIVVMIGALATEIVHSQLGVLMPILHITLLGAIIFLRLRVLPPPASRS
jgi:putative oxidoreductase